VTDGPFDAAIFDLDGLLVDSEPLWHEAEVSILGGLGVPIDAGEPRRTKGMFVGEVTQFWYERHPWAGPSPAAVADEVVDRVILLVLAKGVRRPGVEQAIGFCRSRGLALALASSSAYRLILPVLDHLGLGDTFSVVHSAQDEAYGKPHPAVFLSAAGRLGVRAERCVVWEDSAAGVLAAKAARMACVAVPEPDERGLPAFGLADVVLGSLEGADDACWHSLTWAGGAEGLAGDPRAPRQTTP
jgi:sugar-phosphatase